MNFEKISVAKRLSIGFGTLIVLLVLVAALGMNGLRESKESLHHLADVNVTKIELLNNMSESIHITSRVMRTIALLHDAAEADKQRLKIVDAGAEYSKSFDALQKMPLDDAGKAFIEKIRLDESAARASNDKFSEMVKSDPEGAIKVLLTEGIPLNGEWQAALHDFSDLQKSKNHKDEDTAMQAYKSAVTFMAIFTALAIILGIAMGWYITRSLLRQLGAEPGDAVAIANGIAQGDLTMDISVKHNDNSSLLYAMKLMRDSLEQIVVQVRSGTDTISVASQQIATGNMDLSSRTEHQASSLEETASSMEELTSTVKQNAGNAAQARAMAIEASNHADQGGKVVEQVISTMSSINESSKKIVDIISVIDGIAFQTNILALNAAVEAARAGEQGRGFAVVASEVRNLAQRSAAAAKEIKTLIGDSVDKVDAGSRLVDQAGGTMREMVSSVRQVTDIISEIAEASREQTAGIEQVNEAITQMDEVTQQNAALVEQAAAAAQSMQDQASTLTDVVGVFKLTNQPVVTQSRAELSNVSAIKKTVMSTSRKLAAPSRQYS